MTGRAGVSALEIAGAARRGEAAAIEVDYLGLDMDTVKSYLAQKDCQFFPELRGAQTMAEFMLRAGFIEKAVPMEQFKYDGVSGN